MKDLIDRQALLEWFKNWSDYDEFSVGYITGVIEDEPSADAVEVVRCKEQIPRQRRKRIRIMERVQL